MGPPALLPWTSASRHLLGLMLTKRPRLPFAVMSSAMSPQISPERMPVSSPKRRALCSTLSFAANKMLTWHHSACHGDEPLAGPSP